MKTVSAPMVPMITLNNREGRIAGLDWQTACPGDYLDNIDAPEFLPTGSTVQCFGYRMASCVRRGEG